jgi:hypothetical protein
MHYPPRPRLTLSVGVIGHRPNRLPPDRIGQIEAEVERVIDLVAHEVDVVHQRYRNYFREEKPQLFVVSALAEGTDRIVARAALAKGFTLDVPIPFLKEKYVEDFREKPAHGTHDEPPAATNSIVEFEVLIADGVARSVLQLPGTRDDDGKSDKRESEKALGRKPRTGDPGVAAPVVCRRTAIRSGPIGTAHPWAPDLEGLKTISARLP